MSAAQTQTPVSESHGVLLTRFLEKEWDALYTTRGAWCRKVGVADSTVYRWSQGVEPDMRNMVEIAHGLGRKLTDILFAAGYIAEDEVKRIVVAPAREKMDLADVIRGDASLSAAQRDALLAVHAAFQPAKTKSARRTVRVTS